MFYRFRIVNANTLEFNFSIIALKESLHIMVVMIGSKQLSISDILFHLGHILYTLNNLDDTFSFFV